MYFHILTRSSLILPRESLGNIPIFFFLNRRFFHRQFGRYLFCPLITLMTCTWGPVSFRSSAFIMTLTWSGLNLTIAVLTNFMWVLLKGLLLLLCFHYGAHLIRTKLDYGKLTTVTWGLKGLVWFDFVPPLSWRRSLDQD